MGAAAYVDRTVAWDQADEQHREDLRYAWSHGHLNYKLDNNQLGVYRDIKARLGAEPTAATRTYVLDSGRRYGKSTIKLTLAFETAIATGTRVPYGAATQKQVMDILNPLIEQWYISDAPPELAPRWFKSEFCWIFPNGGRVGMYGMDLYPDRMRGAGTKAWFLDEAAFMRRLEYIIRSVIKPMQLTEEQSFGVMGSTPPESPGHIWSTKIVPEHRRAGRYAHRTIEDNHRITDATREAFIVDAGGREATFCRREYFAEHVIEETKAILPEWPKVKAQCVKTWDEPDFYDAYVSMDPGHANDIWALLFGYYDFMAGKLIVVDEVEARRETTNRLAGYIAAKEMAHWGKMPPFRRVSDTDTQVIRDLRKDHKIKFVPTRKDNKRAAINTLRRWLQEKRVIIHPRCKSLIDHLDFGVWRDSSSQQERGFDYSDEFGHYDFIDALVYLVRNVEEKRNPFPPEWSKLDPHRTFFPPGYRRPRGVVGQVGRMLGMTPRKRRRR